MEKIWFKSYPFGVEKQINHQQYTSLVDFFLQSCQNHADNIAYINFHSVLTYQQLEQKSLQLAIALQQLNLVKGARIAVMMPNILQYPVAMFAILRAGFIVVNINPLYTTDEIFFQINNSQAEVIIVLANFAKTLENAYTQTTLKHIIITQIGDLFSPIKKIFINNYIKYIKKAVPQYNFTHQIMFDALLKNHDIKKFNEPQLTYQDIAFLQYTGGTTGVTKGAILTHGNMLANILQAAAWIKPWINNSNNLIITALPLYHIFSLTANCMVFIKIGAKNLLITDPHDLKYLIQNLKKYPVTVITGVNTLFNALLSQKNFRQLDFTKLKLTLSGGMALQKNVALLWKKITKNNIIEAYGLTEASPAIAINPLNNKKYNGKIGLPLPETEISIRDNNDNEVGVNVIGELCVKGPQIMQSYWQQSYETAHVFTHDGFLKTGDLATIDPYGYLQIVDRKKNMIIISGFNVYPNEIETVISKHQDVSEVVVIGITLPNKTNEIIKACIVKRNLDLTANDILIYCKKHLTHYKIPKIIEFYQELPKSTIGKILKYKIT